MDKIKVFLDTNVLIAFFRGDAHLQTLFSPEMIRKIKYAVNPVVYQELLLVGSKAGKKFNLDELSGLVEIIELDPNQTADQLAYYLKSVRSLRNMAVHTNDVLILSTARECDYLLTYDKVIIRLSEEQTVKAMSPEDFIQLMEAE